MPKFFWWRFGQKGTSMNEHISIGQWLAFAGPQILLIFQIWREGRAERQQSDKRWTQTQISIEQCRCDIKDIQVTAAKESKERYEQFYSLLRKLDEKTVR